MTELLVSELPIASYLLFFLLMKKAIMLSMILPVPCNKRVALSSAAALCVTFCQSLVNRCCQSPSHQWRTTSCCQSSKEEQAAPCSSKLWRKALLLLLWLPIFLLLSSAAISYFITFFAAMYKILKSCMKYFILESCIKLNFF